jgi:hypothetical protein
MEVERVEMTLPHWFGHQIKQQKMKKQKYVVAYAANKQTKIHNNQQKQRRRWGRGIQKETSSGRNVLGGRFPAVWDGELRDTQN